MKTNHFFLTIRLVFSLTISLLGSASLQAQTYAGATNLTASPTGLEASIYPVQNRLSTIRVNFNNPTGALVRVLIRDENGRKVYDELDRRTTYRARIDLASMPVGNYSIDLITKDDRISQAFTIEPPTQSLLTMKNRPERKIPEEPSTKGLIVSF